MPFESVACPICGYWHSTTFWLRISQGTRPSTIARVQKSLGKGHGFKTLKAYEDYRFVHSDFIIIRNQIFDTLRVWLVKGTLSIKEFKEAFSYLFREERVKEAFISKSKPLLLVWRKVSPYREGSTKDVLL